MPFKFKEYRRIYASQDSLFMSLPKDFKAKKGDIVACYISDDGKSLLVEIVKPPKPKITEVKE